LFLPNGPFAILPMIGNRSSIVWTEAKAVAAAVMALDDAQFADALRKRFGSHWGHAEPIGPRWTYPLSLHLARRYVGTGFCLIGDAAHGIHPITGQGLNLGLRDVAALTEVIADAARIGLDIGSVPVLERYERWRRADNVVLAVMTDGLNRLFSSDFPPLRFARDLGMAAVGQIGPLRRVLTRHFMGDLGLKPKLLDGISLES
jgi:2-octaprenyl-6-methoxyphenol hydroxylase